VILSGRKYGDAGRLSLLPRRGIASSQSSGAMSGIAWRARTRSLIRAATLAGVGRGLNSGSAVARRAGEGKASWTQKHCLHGTAMKRRHDSLGMRNDLRVRARRTDGMTVRAQRRVANSRAGVEWGARRTLRLRIGTDCP
jgi:hypothetical protein